MKLMITKKTLSNVDHLLIFSGSLVSGINFVTAPAIVKSVITDSLRGFLLSSTNVNVVGNKTIGILKVSPNDAVLLVRHLLNNLDESRKYSSNAVASNSQIGNVIIDYIFKDLQLDVVVNAIKNDYPEWMPMDLEYFYNKDIVSLGVFLFRSKFNLISAYEKSIELQSSVSLKDNNPLLNLLVYTATYLEIHNNYILNKITHENTLLYSIKDKSDVTSLIKGENLFQTVDDALYFIRALYLLLDSKLRSAVKILISPDLAANLGVQQFLNNFVKIVGVHLSLDPLIYGATESKVYNHYLDNKGLLFELDVSDEIKDRLDRDSLSAVMNKCFVFCDDFTVKSSFKKNKQYKIDFIVTAHAEAAMSIRSIWNLIGVIDLAGMSDDASITCIIDKGSIQTKSAIYSFAKELAINNFFIYEVDFGDLSSSRNFAIANSKADYISIHDADDFVSLNWLSKIKEESNDFTVKNLIFHPKVNIFFGDGERVMWSPCMIDDKETIEWANLLVDNFWTSCSAGHASIYKKFPYELIDKSVGVGFEDWSWNLKTIENNYSHRAIPQTSLFVRLKPAVESLNKQSVTHGLIPKFTSDQIDLIINMSLK